jgi:hypothetical protein
MEIRRFILNPAIFLLLVNPAAKAVNLEFKSIEYDENTITARLLISDSLPEDLTGYIKKGVPVSFEYEIDIWESRAGWLDRHIVKEMVVHKLRYDTWEKDYEIITLRPEITVENHLDEYREVSDLVKSSGRLEMGMDDTTGRYYMTGKLIIKTMSLSNLKEVESWLKGEISGAKKPEIKDAPDKFGEFLFNTALKITGLKNISEEARTPFFTIENGEIIFSSE